MTSAAATAAAVPSARVGHIVWPASSPACPALALGGSEPVEPVEPFPSAGFGLEPVEKRNFGGLLLVLVVAVPSIAIALPLGIALGLGRQYLILPFRWICAASFAFFNAIPMILQLYAAIVLSGYAIPLGVFIDPIYKVIFVIALHSGCKIASALFQEMRALPQTQWEAARTLGMGQTKALWLVILPQVMRVNGPKTARVCAGVVRDTSLLGVVGLLEPVALTNAIRADANWNGIVVELFLFAAVLYGVICLAITLYAGRLERQLKARGHHTIMLG